MAGDRYNVYLDDDLLRWVRETIQPGQTVPGQLREFAELLRHLVESDRTRFGEREALALADVANGWYMEPSSMPYLWAEVDDAVRHDDLARRWEIDGAALVRRLRDELSPVDRVIVALKLRRALNLARDGEDLGGALRAAGLVREAE